MSRDPRRRFTRKQKAATRKALAGKPGRPKKGTETVENINRFPPKGGTDYTLARLKRDRPDLYNQVTTQSISLNAAAIAAGIRRPKTTIYTDNVTSAVAVLLKHFTAEQIVSAVNQQGRESNE